MTQTDKKLTKKEPENGEPAKFKGRFTGAIGRRKTATAKIRLYQGDGLLTANGVEAKKYFTDEFLGITIQPLKLAGLLKDFNVSVNLAGGGKKAQAEAARHGLARALLLVNPDLRASFRAKGWLTRDDREKERKKPGLKKARRAPQWAKR